jgi:hypothetical protein
LPDIKNGVISLPKTERMTNGIALVPFEEGETFHLDPSMFEPTLRRRKAYEAAGGSYGDIQRFIVREAAITKAKPSDLAPSNYAVTDYNWQPPTEGIFMTSRPIIYIRSALNSLSPETVGRLCAHEVVHATQCEEETAADLTADPATAQVQLAHQEADAYRTGAIILDNLGHGNGPYNGYIDYAVENLRQQNLGEAEFVRGMVDLRVVPPLAQYL